MSASTAWRRLGLWRVTRNPLARGVYDCLTAAGVHVGRLDQFVGAAGIADGDFLDGSPVDDVRIQRANEERLAALAADPVAPDDRVVTARVDGHRVGYCVLSDRPVYVPALDRCLAFPGAYLWRVYVEPAERGQGIGTMLVAAAVDAAATEFGAETVTALVAPDNLPSRRAFEGLGFTPRDRYTTIGIGSWTWTRGAARP